MDYDVAISQCISRAIWRYENDWRCPSLTAVHMAFSYSVCCFFVLFELKFLLCALI